MSMSILEGKYVYMSFVLLQLEMRPRGKLPPRYLPSRQLRPKTITPRKFTPPGLLSPGQLPRTGSYLGQITSRKRVAAQNWKRPNRDKIFKITK